MDRKSLRQRAIGREFLFPSELVTFDGVTFEVRTPTVAARSRIVNAGEVKIAIGKGTAKSEVSEFNQARMMCFAAIECTFVPAEDAEGRPMVGGTERVFEDTDLGLLLESPPAGIADVLGQVALRLMNVKVDSGKA